jgi:mannose-6-phosphate isomerase-like protein (cupin superfamily)
MNENLVCAGIKTEFPTRERIFITERLNDPAVPDVSLADARLEPGITTELHRLTVNEWYVIQQGGGLMEVGGGEPFAVSSGEVVVIPAGTSQRITNTGDADLLFQCICMPRFTEDSYCPMENNSQEL